MKISNHLPHFKDATLLVSAGKQEAKFFVCNGDEVTQLKDLKLKTPVYTDREGYLEGRPGGRVSGGGPGNRSGGGPNSSASAGRTGSASDYEMHDDETLRSFLKQLGAMTDTVGIENSIQKIFVFCPTYLSNRVEDTFTREWQEKIQFIFFGNYLHQHPFVLLAKVQEYLRVESEKGITEPISAEAQKILNTPAVN